MPLNLKSEQGLKQYQENLKLGVVEKVDPIEKAKQNPKSLRAAINAMCYDCCCNQKPEVKFCTAVDCPLHTLRPWQPKEIS